VEGRVWQNLTKKGRRSIKISRPAFYSENIYFMTENRIKSHVGEGEGKDPLEILQRERIVQI